MLKASACTQPVFVGSESLLRDHGHCSTLLSMTANSLVVLNLIKESAIETSNADCCCTYLSLFNHHILLLNLRLQLLNRTIIICLPHSLQSQHISNGIQYPHIISIYAAIRQSKRTSASAAFFCAASLTAVFSASSAFI